MDDVAEENKDMSGVGLLRRWPPMAANIVVIISISYFKG